MALWIIYNVRSLEKLFFLFMGSLLWRNDTRYFGVECVFIVLGRIIGAGMQNCLSFFIRGMVRFFQFPMHIQARSQEFG